MPWADWPQEVLVLRGWLEGHRSPMRVRVIRLDASGGERTSTVFHSRDDVLALVAWWLDELELGGRGAADDDA